MHAAGFSSYPLTGPLEALSIKSYLEDKTTYKKLWHYLKYSCIQQATEKCHQPSQWPSLVRMGKTKESIWIQIKHSGAEAGIFRETYVITLAANSLDACIAKSPTAMVLTTWDKRVFVLHDEEFQCFAPPQFREVLYIYCLFSQKAQNLCIHPRENLRLEYKLVTVA